MGLLEGLVGGAASALSSYLNYKSQAETNAMEVELADTAVQRRSKDMAAAGINPLMAAGQPAAVPGLSAPQVGNPVADAFESAAKTASIAQTEAQTELTRASARKANTEADVLAATAASDVHAKLAGNEVTIQSVQDRIKTIGADRVSAEWRAAGAEVDSRIAAALNGIPLLNPDGSRIDPGAMLEKLAGYRLQAAKLGLDKTSQEIAALAMAAQSSTMNADFLRRIGLPPMIVDLIMRAAGSAAGMALR